MYSVVNKFNWKMFVASFFTLILYIVSIVTFRTYFDLSYIDGKFLWKVVALTVASWLPLHVFKVIMDCIDPPEQKKILSNM